jgi:hypothetical protein
MQHCRDSSRQSKALTKVSALHNSSLQVTVTLKRITLPGMCAPAHDCIRDQQPQQQPRSDA